MDEPTVNEVQQLIERLNIQAEKTDDEELKTLLVHASGALTALSDFSINLVSPEGDLILAITDEQAREIMFQAVDNFVQTLTMKNEVNIPEHVWNRGIPDLDAPPVVTEEPQ